jgi:hypothetical protein
MSHSWNDVDTDGESPKLSVSKTTVELDGHVYRPDERVILPTDETAVITRIDTGARIITMNVKGEGRRRILDVPWERVDTDTYEPKRP